jgi:hypothetical protein
MRFPLVSVPSGRCEKKPGSRLSPWPGFSRPKMLYVSKINLLTSS